MSLKPRAAHKGNHERWLVSYADFMTLLFAFFVVMYAASALDKGKIGKLAMAIKAAFQELGMFSFPSGKVPLTTSEPSENSLPEMAGLLDAGGMSSMAKLQKELQQTLGAEIKKGEVALKAGHGGLVVSLREVGFFDSGSADVKLKSEPTIARIAKSLRTRPFNIRIEGHTDNIPIHTDRYDSNWELSTARATAVAKLFITKYEFPPEHLSAAGFAEFHPVAPNETEQGRGLNRRVDIVIESSPPKEEAKQPSGEAHPRAGSNDLKETVSKQTE